MKFKYFSFLVVLFFSYSTVVNAQLGLKAGVNLANEIKSLNLAEINTSNLTGYQIGLVYQAMPKKSGLGVEIGALLSQKGSVIDSTNLDYSIQQGYRELNYIEVPLNLRYHISIGFIGFYGFGGVYGGYELNGKVVDEIVGTTQDETFQTFMDHVDYGYNFGAGVELFRKVQLGATWSQGV
ncbi:MAG: outer membrane beta-barrel protein, partial [Paludibacter sp.]